MSTSVRVPRAIRMLTLHGAEALKPKMVNGRYQGPMVSKRVAAEIRKKSVVEGTFGQFIPNIGGWNPAWDEPRKIYFVRPLKGHAEERNREERAKKIDAAMKSMPDKLKKYEQEAKDRKPKKDILYQFTRLANIAKGNLGIPTHL